MRSEPNSSEDAAEIGAVGHVVTVRGSSAQIFIKAGGASSSPRITVGSFLAIEVGHAQAVAMVTEIEGYAGRQGAPHDAPRAIASVNLVGEIAEGQGGVPMFRRGVSCYPTIGDVAGILTRDHMRLIHDGRDARSIEIGHLFQDQSMPARVDVDSLLARHFAVLGSTGVGKSSGVAIILRELLEARADLRIFLLDCHNEYAAAFGDRAHIITSRDLKLPFWLFNFEEFVDVIYGGRSAVDEELEILSELIPIAKSNYLQYKTSDRFTLKRADPKTTGYTVDTPVPYLLQDLVALLDERMGKLENRASRMNYHRLMSRIEMIRNNPRYDFMFENANVGGDTMAELLGQLFRIDSAGKPMAIMQLAGFPVEVVDAVVCVLCRMAFDFGLWSDGAIPLLFVCEEAHRYAAVDRSVGFGPTRRALSRIAKEGRKYGVYLGLVSQRPSELDPNIISQCATLFAMRMANDADQALLRSAISDSAADLLAFVPSLSTRELLSFGEAVPFPARMRFKTLEQGTLLRHDADRGQVANAGMPSTDFIHDVVDRWRRAVTGRKLRVEDAPAPANTVVTNPAPSFVPMEPPPAPISAAQRLDQARYQLLKR